MEEEKGLCIGFFFLFHLTFGFIASYINFVVKWYRDFKVLNFVMRLILTVIIKF